MKSYNSYTELHNAQASEGWSVHNAYSFQKLNDVPLSVETVYNTNADGYKYFTSGFSFDGDWYDLSDFIGRNNPKWGKRDDYVPQYIHAYDGADGWNPYYISFSNNYGTVDVYDRVYKKDV